KTLSGDSVWKDNINWQTITLDLSQFAGTVFNLSFQTSLKYNQAYQAPGCKVYIDNIKVYEPAQNDLMVSSLLSPVSALCGDVAAPVEVVVTNKGLAAQGNVLVTAIVTTPTGVDTVTGTSGVIPVFGSDTVLLSTIDASAEGTYSVVSYASLANDQDNSNDTLNASFTITELLAVDFIDDFEGASKWNTSGMYISLGHGKTGKGMFKNFYSAATTGSAIMKKKIGVIPSGASLAFDYRIVNFTGYPNNATTLNTDSFFFMVSTDCGTSYDTVYVVDSSNHINSINWAHRQISLASYAGQSVLLKFAGKHAAGDYYFDLDNIGIVTPPTVDLGADTSFCVGDSILLDAGTGAGYTYLWTANGDTLANTTSSITVDTVGTFTVEIFAPAGMAYDTIELAYIPLPTIVSFTGSADICAGDSTILKGEFTGASPWTFLISENGSIDTITVTNPVDSGYVSPIDTTVYFITQVTDGNGCVAVGNSDTVTINVNPLPVVSFTGLASTYCVDGLADTLVGIPANGVFSGNGIQGTVFNPSMAGAGNHVITYVYTDANSCSNSAVNNTTVVEVLTTTQDATICEGDTASISVLASVNPISGGGVFFSEYIEGSSNNKALEIYNGTAATINLDEYSIMTNYNGNPWSGQYHFPAGATLTAGDVFVIANDQSDSTILAVADDTLAYNAGGYVVGFNGNDVRALFHKTSATDSVMIDIIGAYDGVNPGQGWVVAGVTKATKNHSLIRKSSVMVGDTSWTAIAGTDSLTSQYLVYPKDDFSHLGSHTVTAGSLTYLWSTGETTASISVSPTTTTTYTVIVDNGNCQATDSVVVTVNPYPVVDLGNDTTIKWTYGSVTLDAGNPNATWLWNTGATTQTETFDNTNLTNGTANTVYVTVTENGCSASDTLVITVMDDVSINGALDNMELNVYPNPTKGSFNMAINGFEGDLNMTIVNLAGQTVYSEKINVTPSYVNKFDVSTLSTGVYYIKLTTENGVKVLKLVIR
ncbi:MAG: hypothetical protein DSY76_00670, partial [Bacteroidetes bacterium]